MSNIKLAMAVAACLLLCSLGTAAAAYPQQADENTRLHVMQATSTGAGSAPQQQVPGMGASQQYGGIQSSQPYDGVMSSTSDQQLASSAIGAGSNYDWLSPGGVSGIHYYGWGYPYTNYGYNPYGYYGYYPATTYRYYWDSPGYYNDFDPWWAANVYGPYRTTYYWYGW